MRTVIAVVATALLVGATSATAGSLVTSASIKNNTISSADVRNGSLMLRDFKGSERHKLVGPPGALSADQVDQVNQALAARNLHVGSVDSAVVSVAPGAAGTAFARCPAGYTAVSGSFGPSSDPFDPFIFNVASNGFLIAAYNAGSSTEILQARAVCIRQGA